MKDLCIHIPSMHALNYIHIYTHLGKNYGLEIGVPMSNNLSSMYVAALYVRVDNNFRYLWVPLGNYDHDVYDA